MTKRNGTIADYYQCENAAHTPAIRLFLCQTKDLVVGERDGSPYLSRYFAFTRMQFACNHIYGDLGCAVACGMAAEAVDNQEHTPIGVYKNAVLIDGGQ